MADLYPMDWTSQEEQWLASEEQWTSEASQLVYDDWQIKDLQWVSRDIQWLSDLLGVSFVEWGSIDGQWISLDAQWLSELVDLEVQDWLTSEGQWWAEDAQWVGSIDDKKDKRSISLKNYFSIPELEAHAWQNLASLDAYLTSERIQCDAALYRDFLSETFSAPQFYASFVQEYQAALTFPAMTIEAGATCPILRASFTSPELYFRMAESYNVDEGFEKPTLAAATGTQLDTAISSGASLEAHLYVPMGVFGQDFETPQIDAFAGAHASVEVESAPQLEAFTGSIGEAKFQLPTITIDLEYPSLDGAFTAFQLETATGLVLDTDVAALMLEASTKNPFVEAEFSAPMIQGQMGSSLAQEVSSPQLVVTLDYPSLDTAFSRLYLQGHLNRIGLDNLYEYKCDQAFHALEMGLSCTSPILDTSMPKMQASLTISAIKGTGSFSELEGWGVLRSSILESVLRYKEAV
jgi:hypothetical protein